MGTWKYRKYLGVITEMTQDFFPSNNNYGLKKKKYKLSPQQAQAILDLRLQKLTNLEQDKIFDDYKKEIESIKNFIKILTNSDELHKVMKTELEDIKNEYGENRRTVVSSDEGELKKEDLIKRERVIVVLIKKIMLKGSRLMTLKSRKEAEEVSMPLSSKKVMKLNCYVKHTRTIQFYVSLRWVKFIQ